MLNELKEIAITHHNWNDTPNIRTTPVKCLLCDDEAVVVVYAKNGCTCSPNKIQPRCMQHLLRANDSNEDIIIIEDFRIWNKTNRR